MVTGTELDTSIAIIREMKPKIACHLRNNVSKKLLEIQPWITTVLSDSKVCAVTSYRYYLGKWCGYSYKFFST